MTSLRMPHLSSRLQGFGTTIFTEMTRLALEHGAINLGQGFPDFDGPDALKDAAIQAIRAGGSMNQYCRMAGIPDLARAVSAHQRRFYDQSYDWESEVVVTTGATEAIFATFQALLEVGDEVILLEPFYDSYRASIAMAGGVPRVVTLHTDLGFRFRAEELAAAVTPKTRAILVNSPNNPTGRVMTSAELDVIAELCRDRDLLAISDEVYEHLVYDGEHIPLATLPGMRERTVQISSTGKTFSFTGWKVGWVCAPAPLAAAIRTAHQFITFCHPAALQHAMALALASDDSYYEELRAAYRARRDRMCAGLARAGFGVHVPQGSYFALADIRPLGYDDDLAFCRMLPARVGVVGIPPTSFYERKEEGRHLVRFAFCKTDAVIDAAVERLGRLRA